MSWAQMSDADLLLALDMRVRRLRDTLRGALPDANITDRFEGLEAAEIIETLRSRR